MVEQAAIQALEAARLALTSHHNCLITDRPDLPRSAETGWTTDFSRELALIDAALELGAAAAPEGATSECSEAPATVRPLDLPVRFADSVNVEVGAIEDVLSKFPNQALREGALRYFGTLNVVMTPRFVPDGDVIDGQCKGRVVFDLGLHQIEKRREELQKFPLEFPRHFPGWKP